MTDADVAEFQTASSPPSPTSNGTRIRPTGISVPGTSGLPWNVQAEPAGPMEPPIAPLAFALGELAMTASNRCGSYDAISRAPSPPRDTPYKMTARPWVRGLARSQRAARAKYSSDALLHAPHSSVSTQASNPAARQCHARMASIPLIFAILNNSLAPTGCKTERPRAAVVNRCRRAGCAPGGRSLVVTGLDQPAPILQGCQPGVPVVGHELEPGLAAGV